jgi:TRAP-type C4-dicarboxylate transport system permease small subunit
VLVVSLPWLTAAAGFYFPGDVFMGEELFRERDGTLLAAVHLGHHHGLDGSLLVLTALLLTRVRIQQARLRLVTAAYLGLMLAYGAVNWVQDFWFEQVVKRGWTDESIPSAIVPAFEPVWGVVAALAVLSALVLLREGPEAPRAPSYSGA